MSPSIFLSHSTKPREQEELSEGARAQLQREHEFARSVADALRASHTVFMDVDGVGYGNRIDSRVLAGLRFCSGGVVFLNERAMTISDWVDTELRVLWAHRNHIEDFPLLLVRFGGVTLKQVVGLPKWMHLDLGNRLQLPDGTLGLDLDDPAARDEVVNAIVQRMDEIPKAVLGTPMQRLRRRMAQCIEALDDDCLRGLLDALPEPEFEPGAGPDQVAEEFWHRGLGEISEALADYWEHPGTPEDLEKLAQSLTPWWIPEAAAAELLARSTSGSERQVHAIRGQLPDFSARPLIKLACGRPDARLWRVAQATLDRGDLASNLALLKDEFVLRVFRQKFTGRTPDSVPWNEVREFLELTSKKQPTFLALRSPDPLLVGAIHDELPRLVVLAFFDDLDPCPFDPLWPALGPGEEQAAKDAIDQAEFFLNISLRPS